MQAIEILQPNKLIIKNCNEPECKNQLKVKVTAASICGSDLKILSGEMEGIKYPLIAGHEWVGIVVDAPPEYQHFLGKKVVPDILYCCATCSYCKNEMPNLCNELSEPGLTLPGGFAEYVSLKPKNAYIVSDKVQDKEATLIEPLAVALYSLKRVNITHKDRVMIIGGGGIGQLIGQCTKLLNPENIILVDHHDFRLELGKSTFANEIVNPKKVNVKEMFDVNQDKRPTKIFEVTGSPNGIKLSFNCAQKNAEIAIVGYSGDKKIQIRFSDIMVKHLSIKGILSPTNTIQEAIKLVEDNKVNLSPLVTHTFKISQAHEAFETAMNKKDRALRVAFINN